MVLEQCTKESKMGKLHRGLSYTHYFHPLEIQHWTTHWRKPLLTPALPLVLEDSVIDELRDVLFKFADTDNSGTITFEELQATVESEPLLVKNLTIK